MNDTQGWQRDEVEATGGHSSVLLDGVLHPWQERGDVGEDGRLALGAAICSFVFLAHNSDENVSTFLYCCERPTAVTLR